MNYELRIKNFWKNWKETIFTGGGIIILFFFLRLVKLTILPIFADEAIYIRWSQVMRAEPALRFLPLSDGKQPLFMWLTIPFFKIFSDPLLAGRFLSVLSGFGSLIGVFLLSYELFKDNKISLLASFFYAVVPYFFFFDRMALVDSFLTMFCIWILFLGILLIKFLRLDLAIITGIVLGGALITKSPAIFFAALMPTTLLVSPWIKKKKKRLVFLGKVIGLWLVVIVFGMVIYNLLRLGPNFAMIRARNQDYVFSYQEVLSHPHDPILIHLKDISGWFPNLLTWPVLILVVLGILLGLKNKIRETLLLLAWLLIPLLAQSAVAKVFTPRYLLYTVWPMLIFAAYSLNSIFSYLRSYFKKKKINDKQQLIAMAVILGLVVFLSFRYDWLLLTDPQKAPLPRKMRSGYLEEWTSGYGINEVRDYLEEKSREERMVVGTEGHFGTLPDGLMIYFDKNPQVTIIGVGIDLGEIPQPLKEASLTTPTYLMINQSRFHVKDDPSLQLILKVPKAINDQEKQDFLLFYRLK